jgi:hypothetical protein
MLAAIDEHFNFLAEELSRFQEEGEDNDVDPLNAENLPRVLAELGLGCAQKEIDGLLKLLVSRGVRQVGLLRGLRNTKHLDIIRHTYHATEGRPPSNFEVVANLANIVGCSGEDEVIERVRAQIESLNMWLEILRKKRTDDEH